MIYHETEHGILYCGDCLDILPTLADKSVDLVPTDPPYGMQYQSAWRTATPQFAKIVNDNNLDWLPLFLSECYRIQNQDTHLYLFCNDYAISEFRNSTEQAGYNPKRALVWVKNNHTSGDLFGDYGNKTEFVVFAHKGKRDLNGKRDCNVLKFDRENDLLHPTQKPVSINGYLILKSSDKGNTILDPFAGSGTTAIACIRLNRKYILIEKEEKYCEIAARRIETELDQTDLFREES